MSVDQVMSHNAVSCRASDTAGRAAELMWNCDIGFLPVVDDDGRAIAAITDRDLCMAAYTQGRALADIPVHTAMSHDLAYVRVDAPLDVAEELMESRQLHRLPVLDGDNRPIGVVTLNDLARAIHRRSGPKSDEVAQVIVAIAEPRTSDLAVAAE